MPLDPQAKRLLDILELASGTPIKDRTPDEVREEFQRLTRLANPRDIQIAVIENGELPGPDTFLRYRRYIPDASTKLCPTCVYFHGGGGVFGSIETHDPLCRILAKESGCQIFSIEYRLAPEYKFPAALSDCFAAVQWITENASRLAIDEGRIAVGGDSAGAGFTAAVCQMVQRTGGPKLALQVLICPALDVGRSTKSRRAFAKGYFLDSAMIDWMVTQLCPSGMDLKDPRLSPIYGELSPNLPPAQIHTAEFDPLRSEGEIYARFLKRAGVSVQHIRHEEMPHNFYCMAGAIPSAYQHIKQIGSAIKSAFTSPS